MRAESVMALLLALIAPAAARLRAPITNGSTVTFGNARFTMVLDNLIRMEHSLSATFDDRPTMVMINRQQANVPAFTVAQLNATALQITLDSLTLTYDNTAGPANRSCSANGYLNNTDQEGGDRVPDYPNGLTAPTTDACCAACATDAYCTAFVYEPSSQGCWLMMHTTGTVPVSDRIFGKVPAHSGFTSANLRIDVHLASGFNAAWDPSVQQTGNLNGTYSALDCYTTPMQCADVSWGRMGPGLIANDGWNVIDDSATPRFVPPPADDPLQNWTWIEEVSDPDHTDWYFHAYGTNFRRALTDYASIAGGIPLPDRRYLGTWWSRYWTYSEQSLIDEVLSGYANYSIPLNVLVMDMDWHDEPTDKTCSSWGNFDFNTTLFPDPQAFIAQIHNGSSVVGHPLAMSLNLHPQSGIDHCMERYAEFGAAIGFDTNTNVTIPCAMNNRSFASTLFNVYLDAEPLHGIDVWWTDYSGCGGSNTQLISNYAFASHRAAARNVRGLGFSRYGGLGNHRYPIGFSGDTFQHEVALDFEIQTTKDAANVLFAWWSHDIGGFHNGEGAPGDATPTNYTASELFLRWVQFGAVAPIMRTHCDHCERRIWEFQYHFPQLRDAFYLRNALVPYLYTMAFQATVSAVAPVHPLYYDFPTGYPEAYTYTHQYMFGDTILAAPISTMADPGNNNLTQRSVWIPPGAWSRWDGSAVITGPAVDVSNYTLAQIPLFVQAGALLPLKASGMANVQTTSPDLMWTAWPVAAGANQQSTTVSVYEDDGSSLTYITQKGAGTTAVYTWTAGSYSLTVRPVQGSYPGMPSTRAHQFQIRGISGAVSGVTWNGQAVPQTAPGTAPGWWVNAEDSFSLTAPAGAVMVATPPAPMTATTTITVTAAASE